MTPIKTLIVLAVIAGASLVFYLFSQGPLPPSEYAHIGGDFTLESKQGAVSLSDFNGKVTVIFFGYTNCPDVCSPILSNVSVAFKMLQESGELDKTQGLFITLDPEFDTVDVITGYMNQFHPKILGLSGSQAQIGDVIKLYKVGYLKEALTDAMIEEAGSHHEYAIDMDKLKKLGYVVSHTSQIFIIRPDGSIGKLLSRTSTPTDIAAAIRIWMPWAK